jgi:hypothetical protein
MQQQRLELPGFERSLSDQELICYQVIQQMPHAQPGMFPNHAWTGEPHHCFDLLAAVTLVAMHRTFRARRLFFAEPATIQSQADVALQILALVA